MNEKIIAETAPEAPSVMISRIVPFVFEYVGRIDMPNPPM